jgi:hypothetical protein
MSDELTFERVMLQTAWARMPEMMQNVGKNMSLILAGRNVGELPKHKGVPIIIVGAGPSLWRENHLRVLKESNWPFPIIVCDRCLIPALREGIVPDYVASVDGSILISKFYDDPIVDEYADKIKAVMPITIHPATVNRFKGEVYWFIPRMDEFELVMSVTRALAYMCVKSVLVTGGNAGTLSWNLGFYLLYDPLILIGIDLSYDTMDRTETLYYSSIHRHYEGDKEKIEKAIKKGFNPYFKRHYLIDPIFDAYQKFMMAYINKVDTTTINCTEGGALYPANPHDKPKCRYFRDVLKEFGCQL